MEEGDHELDSDQETPILGDIIYKDGNGNVQIALGNDKPSNETSYRFPNNLLPC